MPGGDANAVWEFQITAGTGTLNVGLTGPATPAVPIEVAAGKRSALSQRVTCWVGRNRRLDSRDPLALRFVW
jgi:hypothetical protein